MRSRILIVALSLCGRALMGQIYPEDSQVNLYFPHLADGGSGAQRWQSRFTFVNPSTVSTAAVALFTSHDDGSDWAIDLGNGAKAENDFIIPPQGRVTVASTATEANITTGWAVAAATIPLQATVAFRELTASGPVLDLTAPATLASELYRSAGNRNLGIALANIYSDGPVAVNVTALDQAGKVAGTAQVSVLASGHKSFNLGQLLPSLPANFLGSVEMDSPDLFLGWTANEDSGMLSTLPAGRADWPISHYDRIWLVFSRVLDAARQFYPNVNFDQPAGFATAGVQLDAPLTYPGGVFNANSSKAGVLTIPFSISELISDSPSEIAFIVAHELGHQVQYRSGALLYPNLDNNNIESDADIIGLLLTLTSGYDPYAAAGAFGKLAMATGTAGINAQAFADAEMSVGVDPHLSWGTRINNLWVLINAVCALPQGVSLCQSYKSIVHPDFPTSAPLTRPAANEPRLAPMEDRRLSRK